MHIVHRSVIHRDGNFVDKTIIFDVEMLIAIYDMSYIY